MLKFQLLLNLNKKASIELLALKNMLESVNNNDVLDEHVKMLE